MCLSRREFHFSIFQMENYFSLVCDIVKFVGNSQIIKNRGMRRSNFILGCSFPHMDFAHKHEIYILRNPRKNSIQSILCHEEM